MREPGHSGGRESAGRERRELYLGSSEQLRSLQVGEDGRDAVRERVSQEGGILGKEKGRGSTGHNPGTADGGQTGERVTAQDKTPVSREPGQAPGSGANPAGRGRRVELRN